MKYSGFTSATTEKLLLDAGAFFKNFTAGTDTFESAVTAGKLLGATAGGGSFSAIPTIRKIEIDGVAGTAVGMDRIDEWVVTLTANMKELSESVIVASLGNGKSVAGSTGYKKITAGLDIAVTDYIDNITWIGRLSGQSKPVIIQVKNAINTGGLTANFTDKNESVVALTFSGRFDPTKLDEVPFEIHYPITV
jgi:hypothetical protein